MQSSGNLTRTIVVMGVAGCGKSTLASALAVRLGRIYVEGDDHHSARNKAKMAAGVPLENADRRDWIASLAETVRKHDHPAVISCSALNPAVRGWLENDLGAPPAYVFLHGPAEILRQRLAARSAHFFDPALLDSQLAALVPPDEAVRIPIMLSVAEQLDIAARALGG